MAFPHTFRPGQLSASDAAALNDLAGRLGGLARLTVRPPLSLVRQSLDGQSILYLDQSAFHDDDDPDSGEGSTRTYVKALCFDGSGGGTVRYVTETRDTGDVLSEWCEDIPVCTSGGLCADLPADSGGGSGGGGGGTVPGTGCATAPPETLYATFGGNLVSLGTKTLAFDGFSGWQWTGSVTVGTANVTAVTLLYDGACHFNLTVWANPLGGGAFLDTWIWDHCYPSSVSPFLMAVTPGVGFGIPGGGPYAGSHYSTASYSISE